MLYWNWPTTWKRKSFKTEANFSFLHPKVSRIEGLGKQIPSDYNIPDPQNVIWRI